MDYPQFLMACVDEYSKAEHDSMMIDIECTNYVNHDEESCPSYTHLDDKTDSILDTIDKSWSEW